MPAADDPSGLDPEAAKFETDFHRVEEKVAAAVASILEDEFEACGGRIGVQRTLAFALAYSAGIQLAGQAAAMGLPPGGTRAMLFKNPINVLTGAAQLTLPPPAEPSADPTPDAQAPQPAPIDGKFSFDFGQYLR